MANKDKEFLDEIKLDIRRDVLHDFINKYWKHVTGIVIGITLISFISITISSRIETKRMQYASQLQEATILMSEQQFSRAEDVLKELLENKKTPKQIKTITGMQLGALLLDQNKDEEALKVYKNVEKITKDSFMKEVAQLIQLNTLIKQNDEKNDLEINSLIKKLDTKDTILHFLVLEQKTTYELNKGMKEEANKTYEDAKLLDATQSSKYRIYEIYESHEYKK